MSELYNLLPPGAVPFGLLAIGEQFKRITANGLPDNNIYWKKDNQSATGPSDDMGIFIQPFELIRPVVSPSLIRDNSTIVADIRRQPAPVCTCSNCAGLLEPGECGCLCRVCASAGAQARVRPIRRYVLHLCPCCSSNVGTMDGWCSTCGQPLRAPAGAVPF